MRLLPVKGTEKDFRTPHALGLVGLDTAFTDLIPYPDGKTRVKLSLGAPCGAMD
jgi:hypothetical protein